MKYHSAQGSSVAGGFAIAAVDAREALDRAKELVERGLTEVQLFDSTGQPYDLADLEQQAAEAENKTLPGEPTG
jgi:hypothetical protein